MLNIGLLTKFCFFLGSAGWAKDFFLLQATDDATTEETKLRSSLQRTDVLQPAIACLELSYNVL